MPPGPSVLTPPPQLLEPLVQQLNELPGLSAQQHADLLRAISRYGVTCHLSGFRAGRRLALKPTTVQLRRSA